MYGWPGWWAVAYSGNPPPTWLLLSIIACHWILLANKMVDRLIDWLIDRLIDYIMAVFLPPLLAKYQWRLAVCTVSQGLKFGSWWWRRRWWWWWWNRNIYCVLVTARSSLLDRSFDLCEFRDDPEPLGAQIRSRRMKILLRKPHMDRKCCFVYVQNIGHTYHF